MIDRLKQEEENAVLKWNSQLADKEAELERLAKLHRGSVVNLKSASSEMDLGPSDLGLGGITALVREIRQAAQLTKECGNCSQELSPRLVEAASQLQILSASINSGKSSSLLQLDLLRCESEENIVREQQRFPVDDDDDEEEVFHSLGNFELQEGDVNPSLGQLKAKVAEIESEKLVILDKLKHFEEELTLKSRELRESESLIAHLRQMSVSRVQQFNRPSPPPSSAGGSLSMIVASSGSSFTELETKCALKDFLLRTLAELFGEEESGMSATAAVRALRNATFKPSYVRGGGKIDFTLESLCRFIESEGNKRSNKVSFFVRVCTL